MKKLLVLSLVLGIASLATAALSMSADKTVLMPGEVATITVSGPGENWLGYIIVEEGGVGALSNPTWLFTPSAGLAYADPYTEAGWGIGYEFAPTADAPSTPPEGAQITFDFSSAGVGTAVVSLWDGLGAFESPEGGFLTFTVAEIPEPATMVLLGLGALVLRKRK